MYVSQVGQCTHRMPAKVNATAAVAHVASAESIDMKDIKVAKPKIVSVDKQSTKQFNSAENKMVCIYIIHYLEFLCVGLYLMLRYVIWLFVKLLSQRLYIRSA